MTWTSTPCPTTIRLKQLLSISVVEPIDTDNSSIRQSSATRQVLTTGIVFSGTLVRVMPEPPVTPMLSSLRKTLNIPELTRTTGSTLSGIHVPKTLRTNATTLRTFSAQIDTGA